MPPTLDANPRFEPLLPEEEEIGDPDDDDDLDDLLPADLWFRSLRRPRRQFRVPSSAGGRPPADRRA